MRTYTLLYGGFERGITPVILTHPEDHDQALFLERVADAVIVAQNKEGTTDNDFWDLASGIKNELIATHGYAELIYAEDEHPSVVLEESVRIRRLSKANLHGADDAELVQAVLNRMDRLVPPVARPEAPPIPPGHVGIDVVEIDLKELMKP